ncbi:MAG TPA: hypothetical protein VGU20_13985 [Stellaceae bacterium]|nr:hypothetical protein [Stellaceae bacterium]
MSRLFKIGGISGAGSGHVDSASWTVRKPKRRKPLPIAKAVVALPAEIVGTRFAGFVRNRLGG